MLDVQEGETPDGMEIEGGGMDGIDGMGGIDCIDGTGMLAPNPNGSIGMGIPPAGGGTLPACMTLLGSGATLR
jgi:hypothetical protein